MWSVVSSCPRRDRIVSEVERSGWVAPGPPTDGRKVLLTLTDAGRAVLEAGRQRRADWLAGAISSQLSADDQRVLLRAAELLGQLAHTSPASASPDTAI
jgi:DNA-binding MarR family transcriptional regulator